MSGDQKTVNTPTDLHAYLDTKWAMIRALMGGTATMRAAGEAYLPKESKEQVEKYDVRINRSFLFNGYRDSVEKIVAKPFARSVQLIEGDGLTEQLRAIEDDTDRCGTSLTALARELLTIAINHGLVHMWVDYPRVDGAPSVADEREQAIRPTFIPIKPGNLIGWQSRRDDTGLDVLTQARIWEYVQENAVGYDSVVVDQVRVLTETGWETYRKNEKGVFKRHESGEWQGFRGVPIVTAYLAREGFMEASPTLEDLAWINVAHWQSSSDQRNILRFARTGLLFIKGVTNDELKDQGGIVLGPSSKLVVKNDKADAKVVEHSGNAIEAGAKDLAALEQQMQVLGLQPFFKMTGGTTATEKKIDESRSETEIQSWIKAIEKLLRDGYELAAKWLSVELDENFAVDIYSDFVVSSLVERDLEALLKMRMSGNLDEETFLTEVKRRGVFGDDVTVEEIKERLSVEGPSLAGIGGAGAEEE